MNTTGNFNYKKSVSVDNNLKGVIEKYYQKNSALYEILINHSNAVKEKALQIAKNCNTLKLDLKIIEEGALLHDIGIFLTDAPQIKCFGKSFYLCHGYLGRKILEEEKLFKHALICERHIGSGITAKEIKAKKLPLPIRDMLPLTPEEEIVCLADKFYNKSSKDPLKEVKIEEIKKDLSRYGKEDVRRFDLLLKKYI